MTIDRFLAPELLYSSLLIQNQLKSLQWYMQISKHLWYHLDRIQLYI